MSIQDEEIAEVFRKEKLAWDSKDIDGIIEAYGRFSFGYRISAWRDFENYTKEQLRSALENFYEDMEYLRRYDTELSTWSEGDIGLAWGFSMEECKHQGQPPERVRTRFTQVYRKVDGEWRMLVSHKDIQPFDEEGKYLKEFTRVK